MTTEANSTFDQLVGVLDYPMFIVTVAVGETKAGCLVGFGSQVSINPPRFLVGLSDKNHTTEVAVNATHLTVHLVRTQDRRLAQLFGEHTGDEIDKFAQCRWSTGPHGMPVLTDAVAWFVGAIVDRIDFGDHIGHLLEPVHAELTGPTDALLTFADVREFEPGHEA